MQKRSASIGGNMDSGSDTYFGNVADSYDRLQPILSPPYSKGLDMLVELIPWPKWQVRLCGPWLRNCGALRSSTIAFLQCYWHLRGQWTWDACARDTESRTVLGSNCGSQIWLAFKSRRVMWRSQQRHWVRTFCGEHGRCDEQGRVRRGRDSLAYVFWHYHSGLHVRFARLTAGRAFLEQVLFLVETR
jgi:hypothetical protein